MANTHREARREARYRQRFQVALGRTSSFTLNVSAGGFCTEVMHVLPAGSAVIGTVRVHGKDYPFTGHVAWARLGNARMNMRGRMGIVFDSPPQDLLRAVAAMHAEAPAPVANPGSRRS